MSGLKVGPLCSRSDQKSFRSEFSRSICLQSVPPAFSMNLQSLVRRRRRRRCVYCGGGATLTLPTLCQSHVLNCPPPTLLPKYFLKYLPTFWYFSFLLVLFGSLWFLGSFLVPVGSILWDIFKVVGSASFKRQMTPFILYLVTLSRLLMRCDINC